MATALAVTGDQEWWTDEQAVVLQQTGIDEGVTRAELHTFLHLCQRTGLDPFSRQIYLIGRWNKRANRKVFTPQTGIDGYRVIAQRTCHQDGQKLSYDDVQWCGPDGAWTDVWLASDPPAASKVTVYRDDAKFSAVALWSEYVPTNKDGEVTGLWTKMPALMLAKVAEALALRKAFPNDMAGVYTAEEMQQADVRTEAPKPRKVSEQDAARALEHGTTPEQERAERLAEQKVVRDALGVKSDGKLRDPKDAPEHVQPQMPVDDDWTLPPEAPRG